MWRLYHGLYISCWRVEVMIDSRNNKHVMLTIVQGNRNIYTISKGETDWKAGAKLWPYCKWLPYCSIWRAPPPTWWLYFPLDLWLSPESRRPPPRVCAASPAQRDERQWDERRRWAGGRQRSLLVGSCWQQAAFFYLLFFFFPLQAKCSSRRL